MLPTLRFFQFSFTPISISYGRINMHVAKCNLVTFVSHQAGPKYEKYGFLLFYLDFDILAKCYISLLVLLCKYASQ